ncbi:vWA domain-containing protein [Sediminicoccus rosea]|jgi:serine/threonine-protein kinase PpkA|uniref:VWA domain-containing protein n=1 Tax=Sediminicoccus rosea TaxID=1225128 RepID=A0ABZ0PI56_9PROT|nr:vWA domain-containing protein [Sediminicoccus rosea]WPB85408.1 vWA domain-containing protein [Sediminicoccus rosea]
MRLGALLLALGLLLVPQAQAQQRPAAPQATRAPLTVEGRTQLFQRVITRPGAGIYERAEANAPRRDIPAFSVFYVYARQVGSGGGAGADGWLEVGEAMDGRTLGWLRADRAIDWRHNLVAAFTPREQRERAMFFRDAALPEQVWLDTRGGAARAQALRQAAERNEDGPVIALEPEAFVDITRQFYLLPILSARRIENEAGNEARLLEVISAPAQAPRTQMADPDALRNYRGAVVFVIDTTISMAPYIDRTREAVRRAVGRIQDTAVRENFRFGMVAYRDNMGGNPNLEYVTQLVSAPDFAAAPDAVLERLAVVREAGASNQGFDEDAIAGIKTALDEVDWSGFGGRFIILITDAGTRDGNDPLAATALGIPEIRLLAASEARQVAIIAVHLRTPEGRNNHARAERQYRELTRRPDGNSLYYPVPNGDVQHFGETVDALSDWVLGEVAAVTGRAIGGIRPPANEAQRRMAEQLERVGAAMRLAYLGRVREQAAPDVVRSFVLDRDFVRQEPGFAPLDVRVLLTRNQLSDLRDTVRAILQAQAATRLSPEDFFSRVRGAAAATIRDPRRLGEFQRLGGVFAEFLQDLPYTSEIADISQQQWMDSGPAARSQIANNLERKLALYEAINAMPVWVNLDGGRNPNEAVYPVPLDALP